MFETNSASQSLGDITMVVTNLDTLVVYSVYYVVQSQWLESIVERTLLKKVGVKDVCKIYTIQDISKCIHAIKKITGNVFLLNDVFISLTDLIYY